MNKTQTFSLNDIQVEFQCIISINESGLLCPPPPQPTIIPPLAPPLCISKPTHMQKMKIQSPQKLNSLIKVTFKEKGPTN
jgi:hypothetical protein